MNKSMITRLLVLLCITFCVDAKRGTAAERAKSKDFQERMQKAIIASDLTSMQRLLNRYSKITMKRFDEVQGWADDIVEERKLKDPTGFEVFLAVNELLSLGMLFVGGVGHYTGLFDPHEFIGPWLTNKIKWACLGTIAISEWKYYTGKNGRLNRSLVVQEELKKSIQKMRLELASKKVNKK